MPIGLKDGMMGTGPYMYKEHIKGQRLVLVKNPNYYDKSAPLLDELHFIPLKDQTARTNALRAGQVDYIEPLPPKDVRAAIVFAADPPEHSVAGPILEYNSFTRSTLTSSIVPFSSPSFSRKLSLVGARMSTMALPIPRTSYLDAVTNFSP